MQTNPSPNADISFCTIPPVGWECTRKGGHTGPCAAVPSEVVEEYMGVLKADDEARIEAAWQKHKAAAPTPSPTAVLMNDAELCGRLRHRVVIAKGKEFVVNLDGKEHICTTGDVVQVFTLGEEAADRIEALTAQRDAAVADRDAAVARGDAAEANIPIVDQHGKTIGDAIRPKSMDAFVDERGTAWTPPTGWAYWKACQDRDSGIAEGARRATAAIVADMRAPHLTRQMQAVAAFFAIRYEAGDHLTTTATPPQSD